MFGNIMPSYKKIAVKELQFAPYQRALNMNRVKHYVNKFDYDVLGVPLVNYREGKYYVIDGQHRIEALKIKGIKTVLCQVLVGLNYEDEARKFVKLNSDRQPLSANQKFAGRVESGEEIANKIVEILKSNGFDYNRNSGIRKENCIGCISCVVKIATNKGLKHLDKVLRVLRNAWYGTETSLSRDLIQGLSTFLAEYPRADEKTLVSALEKLVPKNIELEANVASVNLGTKVISSGSCTCPAVAKVIRDYYLLEKRKG